VKYVFVDRFSQLDVFEFIITNSTFIVIVNLPFNVIMNFMLRVCQLARQITLISLSAILMFTLWLLNLKLTFKQMMQRQKKFKVHFSMFIFLLLLILVSFPISQVNLVFLNFVQFLPPIDWFFIFIRLNHFRVDSSINLEL